MYTKRAKEMQCDVQSCRHQLNRPPDLVEDVDGVTYLVFECLRCGCGISLRLDSMLTFGSTNIPP